MERTLHDPLGEAIASLDRLRAALVALKPQPFQALYPYYMTREAARALLAESRRRNSKRRAERAWQWSVARAAQSVIRAAMGKPVAPFCRGA